MIKSPTSDTWHHEDLNWNERAMVMRIELDAFDADVQALANGEDTMEWS